MEVIVVGILKRPAKQRQPKNWYRNLEVIQPASGGIAPGAVVGIASAPRVGLADFEAAVSFVESGVA